MRSRITKQPFVPNNRLHTCPSREAKIELQPGTLGWQPGKNNMEQIGGFRDEQVLSFRGSAA